ncbi:MAG: hypothetical protein K0S33_322 [Bacteroidetes bacterium]|jgi:hypothetical protein|nr:hypothetical protein [Bacteroidota bacterium]
MKKHILFPALLVCFGTLLHAQTTPLKTPPSGGNKKAMVAEQIGITTVTINYDRPGVKGREGKIYGTSIVYEGYDDLSVQGGTSKKAPWRAGANENTTIAFNTDVTIEGKALPAGKYGFFVAYGPQECTLIFSKDNGSWGSYFYDEKNDALRVKVKPAALDKSVEWLKYEFIDQTASSATIALQWEKVSIPFKIEVDLAKTQIDEFRTALKSDQGFNPEAYQQAASFCLANNTNLDEGMVWATNAAQSGNTFPVQSTYAGFLELKGRKSAADSVMKVAMESGNMFELHQYGRRLLNQKRNDEALEVFKTNAKKNPKKFTTYVGLARGFSGKGDYKNALANAKAALPLAPDAVNKGSVEGMIKKLEEGKDIN